MKRIGRRQIPGKIEKERQIMRLRLETWVVILIIINTLCMSSQVKPGQSMEIGLLTFSRLVFPTEKSLMGQPYKNLENILINRFDIKHYFDQEEISFAEIESPENMIDQVMTRDTPGKLEEFCREKNLDGIIFGHFHQEENIIIVLRFYYSNKLARGLHINTANQIKSFRKEIKVKKLNSKRMKKVSDNLMDQLENFLEKIQGRK
jgi:hypothetical protein